MKRRLGIIVLLLLSLVLNGCVGVKTPQLCRIGVGHG
mgnify:CR=1 FL=1